MKSLRQFFVFLLVLIAGLYMMLTFVPASRPYVAETGLLDLLGIEVASQEPGSSGRGWGGGGPSLVVTAAVSQETLADRITAIGPDAELAPLADRGGHGEFLCIS